MSRIDSADATGAIVGAIAIIAILGCGPKGWLLADMLADKAKCAIANQNLPNEEILKRCLVQPEDAPRVLELVGTAREQAAMQAVHAAAIQAEKDQRAGLCK
jgi:hypothetical protein